MKPSSSRALENSSQSRELAQRGLELVDCTRGRIGDSAIEKLAMSVPSIKQAFVGGKEIVPFGSSSTSCSLCHVIWAELTVAARKGQGLLL